jgi:bile acid-coenzyme A ligase
MTMVSYGRRLTDLATQAPTRPVLICIDPDGAERIITRLDLERRSNQLARAMNQRGVGQGSLVAVALPNIAEHYFATYAAWKLGATVLPVRWSLPEWERDRLLGLSDPMLVVAPIESDGGSWPTMTLDEIAVTTNLDDRPLDDRVPSPARAIATSGSTGSPKLIVSSIPGEMDPDVAPTALVAADEHTIQLVTSPLYHTNGFGSHIRLQAGGTIVLVERFDAQRVVDLIGRWNVNHIILVPTMLQRIARLPDVRPEQLASIEILFYGGAPLAPWVAERWLELMAPERFFFQYGGTEELGGTMTDGHGWLSHCGTVGVPVGCELRILGDDGIELPVGEIGDIYFRRPGTPTVFRYVGAPQPPMTEDGFTTYGDLGWVDEDGYLYIADRRVDMIISGGANVFPAEVEAALSEHPGLADAVVIGLPDAEWGQRVHAIVEVAAGRDRPDGAELKEHCRQRLIPYKVPKSFEIVERIPRSEAGKINRSSLVAARTDT